MKTTHLARPRVSAGLGAKAVATATTRSGTQTSPTLTANSDRQVRFTPPLAFEVEEFHSRIPDDDWRHQHGVPQTLIFPSGQD